MPVEAIFDVVLGGPEAGHRPPPAFLLAAVDALVEVHHATAAVLEP